MSLLNKVKNFFYEDVDDDEEDVMPKKEVKKEEVKEENRTNRVNRESRREYREINERREIKQQANNDLNERELFKSEKTFNFPMDIGDDIFENKESQKKPEERREIKEEKNIYARRSRIVNNNNSNKNNTRNNRKSYFNKEEKVEKKKFHPSPVVSPVYGILDKDYTVDDTDKLGKTKEFSIDKKTVDFDTVRNRAYKELDDEIEKTLSGTKDLFYNLDDEKKDDVNIDNNLDDTISDVKITYNEEDEEDLTPDVNITNKKDDKDDLFNIIDDMYNKEGK